MKRERNFYKLTTIALILILAFLFFWYFLSSFISSFLVLPQLSTKGFIPSSVSVELKENEGIVKLTSNCKQISMVVDKNQAISIGRGIERILGPRPYTHDLIKDMLKNFGIQVLMVKITEARNETCSPEERCDWRITYISKLFLKQGNLVLGLDSRPSDALAIAARTEYEVPVFVNESIFEFLGEKIC
ncbi:MAG: bifunctional nuclease family protein [Candidatus Aenigmarchaeota archaeon]|nr:bifunctional nuclease family protein [Candidatus Aenigmarchaeota archaeon]